MVRSCTGWYVDTPKHVSLQPFLHLEYTTKDNIDVLPGREVKNMKTQDTSVDRNSAVYIGIDVHRYQHTAVAANRFEEEMGEFTFPNTPDGVRAFLRWSGTVADHAMPRIIGIEGTNGNGKLLRNAVTPVYSDVYEINPIYTKQRRDHGTRGDKSDPVDAKLMIEVLTRKLDELPKVTRQDTSPVMQALGELVAFHDDLTRSQTRIKNQLHRLFYDMDPISETSRSRTFSRKRLMSWLAKTTQSHGSVDRDIQRMILRSKIHQLLDLEKTRGQTDIHISKLLTQVNGNLVSLPGVGIVTAAKIVSAVKGIGRFTNIRQFVKYAGIAPVERQSGKTRKHKQAKGGNRQLNTAIYTIALTQLRCNPKGKAYFEKKIAEGKTKKHALRCLMKRVACIVYGMMRSGEVYRKT